MPSSDEPRPPSSSMPPYVGTVPTTRSVVLSPVVPSWLVSGGSLLLGYLVAEATGARGLGGLVLLVGVVWSWLLWHRRAGVQVAIGLTSVYIAAFAFSHVLADAIGAIPSVLLVSAVVATSALLLADRHLLAGRHVPPSAADTPDTPG